MSREEITLGPGMLVMCPGIYRVEHSTCGRGKHEAYMWQGAVLPECPECHVTYRLVRDESANQASSSATNS